MDDHVTTLAHLRYDPTALPSAGFVVRVLEGPDRGATLKVVGTEAQRLLVGTSEAADLRLADATVSRRHLALEVSGARLRLVDLDTTNGTHVGGLRVRDAELEGGESVRLGQTTLVVERIASEQPAIPPAESFGALLGWSREMRRLYPLLARVAKTNVPVVIEGETGTGKEAVAEAIHEAGARAGGPFLVFDCTAFSPAVVESELFGHERGAFTGATGLRRGIFEQANGGTLLLDEIGDLELPLQAKLLRLIDRGEFRRVGGNDAHRADVRILAATRRDLDRAVAEGRFRDDLFHRLAVGRIELPPLRTRRGDVAFLALHFAAALGAPDGIPRNVLDRWERHAWPGNVRELRNAVARYLALGDDALTTKSPPPATSDPFAAILAEELPFPRARERVVLELERRYVEAALAKHGGNVVEAARASGIGRRYFDMLRSRVK